MDALSTSWHSYPKIWALGHRAISELFFDDVTVEEKIDGSQFSWGIFGGELKIRSKGQQMNVDAPEGMFQKAADTVKALVPLLHEGWTYRAEYLQKPKHNVLAYDRAPQGNLILFDVNTGEEAYLSYEEKKKEAERLGLEIVPLMFQGRVESPEAVLKLMDTVSVLGGQKIEGMVFKNYKRFGIDKKVLMGKYVSETFKEVHKGEWRSANPVQSDILTLLGEKYRTPARWEKAVQHLRERGALTSSPKDIGDLIKEAKADLLAECEEEIKSDLFKWAFHHVERASVRGMAEWYKEKLLQTQFEQVETA